MFGETEAEEGEEVKQKDSRLIWMQATENVAEVSKETFQNVLDFEVYTYLNFLSYCSYKSRMMEEKYKKNK